jgi:hypothetical protein
VIPKFLRFTAIILIASLLPSSAVTRPWDTMWSIKHGGRRNETAVSVRETPDGGYIVLAKALESGPDLYLVRFNRHGVPLWERTYLGAAKEDPKAIEVVSDSGFVITGEVWADSSDGDVQLWRMDRQGGIVWKRSFGGAGRDWGHCVREVADGGFIVVGNTESFGAGESDVFLIRTDSDGKEMWTNLYGGAGKDIGYSVAETPDSGYVIAGTSSSFSDGALDFYLVKTNREGEIEWERSIGGDRSDVLTSVCLAEDGYYICAGYQDRPGTNSCRAFLMRADRNGVPRQTYTTASSGRAWFNSIRRAPGSFRYDSFIAAGGIAGYWGVDAYVVCASGFNVQPEWTHTYEGINSGEALMAIPTSDGCYVFTGSEWSDYSLLDLYLVKTVDEVGPDRPLRFDAYPGQGYIELRWTSPPSPDVAGTLIRYDVEDYPCDVRRGYAVPNSNWGRFDGGPSEEGAFIHEGTFSGQKYFYCAFAYDSTGNYSRALKIKGVSEDWTPPGLSVAVFQNPYLSRHADIYLIGSDELDSASVSLTVDETETSVLPVDPLNNVWRADLDLPPSSGIVTIKASAGDMAGNDTTVVRQFGHGYFASGRGGTVYGPEGIVRLSIGNGVLTGEAHVLVIPEGEVNLKNSLDKLPAHISTSAMLIAGESVSQVYHISPRTVLGGGEAYIEWEYRNPGLLGCTSLEQVYIEHQNHPSLQCCFDTTRCVVGATVTALGSFTLCCGDARLTHPVDSQFLEIHASAPNPFSSSTGVQFETRAHQDLRVAVYDVTGRLVASLLDGFAHPGLHEIVWDGTGRAGEPLPPGVYIIMVETGSAARSEKVVIVR